MSMAPFFEPLDGYIYGWRWSNGDEAWWSTREAAEAHPTGLVGPGVPIRRRYELGEVEDLEVVC
jgi:hypothetical protein